jgi:hypothetical protein
MRMNNHAGFLFISVVMLIFRLYSLINPKAVRRENTEVVGFPKTGFAWMPVCGSRLVGVAQLVVSGLCLYMFSNALRSSTLFLSKSFAR